MAEITRRWTQQPPAGTKLDKSNPITEGLRWLWTASSKKSVVGDTTITGTGFLNPGEAGLGYNVTANSEVPSFGVPTGWNLFDAAGFTIFILVDQQAGSGFRGLIGQRDGVQSAPTWALLSTGTRWYIENMCNDLGAFSNLAGRYLHIVTGRPGGTAFGYTNGILTGSSTCVAANTATAIPVRLAINRLDFPENLLGNYYMAALWQRQISSAEVAQLTAKPWQLFAPRRIWVPVAAAGGATLPTLSNATFVPGSVTATSFRPRVTATY